MNTLQSLVGSLPSWGKRPAAGLRGECGSYWLTYDQLHRAAWSVAQNLAGLHLAAGERIVLWAPNRPEWVACLLGAALRGLVVVPVDAQSDALAVAQAISQTGAVLVIFGPEQNGQELPVASKPLLTMTQGVADGRAEHARVPVDSSSPAVILFTSGSSGEPRPVTLSHGNLISQTMRFGRWRYVLRLIPVRLLALSPMSHVQGLILGALLPLSIGLSTLYTHSADPDHLMATIRLGRIGILLAVPGILDMLERRLVQEIADRFGFDAYTAFRLRLIRAIRLLLGPRFRAVFTGGATLPLNRELFWRRAGTQLVQGYGSTETAAMTTVNWPWSGRAGSIGRAVHEGSLRLADDGEILVRGPHVSAGMELTDDGFYRTGDLARRDTNDRLFLLGRKNDMIVTAEGHNIHPVEIETALRQCAGVRDAMASGSTRDGLESIHAILLLEPNAHAGAAIREANLRLPNGHRIRDWSVWPHADFPRGPLGKLKRGEVIHWMQAAPACDWRSLLDHAARSNESRNPREIADLLREQGLDSIHVIQVMAKMFTDAAVEQTAGAEARPGPALPSLRPEKETPPKWQYWPGTSLLRVLARTVSINPLLALLLQVETAGMENLAGLRNPFILALKPEDRQHPADYLAVYRALPRRLSRRLVMVMRSNPPDGFAPYLHPDGTYGPLRRFALAALFHVGLPLVFPFALFPAATTRSTMLGLAETAAAIDRGYSPITVWGAGTELLAAETGAMVVPVRLSGNDRFKQRWKGRRIRVRVTFGTTR